MLGVLQETLLNLVAKADWFNPRLGPIGLLQETLLKLVAKADYVVISMNDIDEDDDFVSINTDKESFLDQMWHDARNRSYTQGSITAEITGNTVAPPTPIATRRAPSNGDRPANPTL